MATSNKQLMLRRQKINERRKNDRLNLASWYVRSLSANRGLSLKLSELPSDLLECKRLRILLFRVIAERRKNGVISSSTQALIDSLIKKE